MTLLAQIKTRSRTYRKFSKLHKAKKPCVISNNVFEYREKGFSCSEIHDLVALQDSEDVELIILSMPSTSFTVMMDSLHKKK